MLRQPVIAEMNQFVALGFLLLSTTHNISIHYKPVRTLECSCSNQDGHLTPLSRQETSTMVLLSTTHNISTHYKPVRTLECSCSNQDGHLTPLSRQETSTIVTPGYIDVVYSRVPEWIKSTSQLASPWAVRRLFFFRI